MLGKDLAGHFRSILLLGGLLLVSPVSLTSQDFGTLIVRARSDHSELTNPNGYGGYASLPLADWIDLRVSHDRLTENSQGFGQVCAHYAPNWGCRDEEVNTTTALANMSMALVPTLRFRERISIGLGAGVSMTQVSTSALGASGRKANFDTPKTGQMGYGAILALGFTPVPTVPVSLVGSAATRWVSFKNCVSYEEVYDPFCGTTRFREFSFGVAYNF